MKCIDLKTIFVILFFLIATSNVSTSLPNLALKIYEFFAARLRSNEPFSYSDYVDNGPKNWPGICTTGKQQSPILFDQVRARSGKGKLVMLGPTTKNPIEVSARNTGQTVVFKFKYKDMDVPQITGGPLGADVYKFHSFNFHFPCEHRAVKFLSRTKCRLEAHYIHYNSKYSSMEEAADKPDGLAIIAVLYEESVNPFSKWIPWVGLLPNVNNFDTEFIERQGVFSYVDAIGFKSVPAFKSYKGSLTAPPCFESVTWIVVDNLYRVNTRDMAKFYKVRDDSGFIMMKNNRPIQKFNQREVFSYNNY